MREGPIPVPRPPVVVAALAAVFVGLSLVTFHYAEGTSYLGTEPSVCANCHIMWPQYDSWQKASHHTVATCVDCHLPAKGLRKYLSKLENGFNHSRAFTLQNFHEPIVITPRNAALLHENCLRCHGALMHDVTAAGGGDAPRCVRCHITVGHGDPVGLGRPSREIPRGTP